MKYKKLFTFLLVNFLLLSFVFVPSLTYGKDIEEKISEDTVSYFSCDKYPLLFLREYLRVGRSVRYLLKLCDIAIVHTTI